MKNRRNIDETSWAICWQLLKLRDMHMGAHYIILSTFGDVSNVPY